MAKTESKNVTFRIFNLGFFGLLGLIFITLKLAEIGQVASWSWWLVLAPIYGPPALIIAFFAVLAVFFLVAALVAAIMD